MPPVIDEDQPNLKIPIPVYNKTGAEVRFEHVLRSCSCADADLKSRTVAPGEQTTLDVLIRARGKTGSQKVNVTLVDSNGRGWRYTIETTIYSRAQFAVPNALLQLPISDPNQSMTEQFDFELFGTSNDSLPVL